MSGHSKWANIKRKKEKTDSQRGKVFTKLGREIAISVKEGGSDTSVNGKLRDIIAKAKANNMPNDNIIRSIKKASGEFGSVNYEEISYEGYGPGGVAIIVEALTDNRNRTASELRHIFDRSNGGLGASGCVSWMFDRKGVIVIEKSSNLNNEDDMMMTALEAGAEDVTDVIDAFEIITDIINFSSVREALEKESYEFISAGIELIPQNTVALDKEGIQKIMIMVDKLEDLDDVQDVYHNLELPDEIEE